MTSYSCNAALYGGANARCFGGRAICRAGSPRVFSGCQIGLIFQPFLPLFLIFACKVRETFAGMTLWPCARQQVQPHILIRAGQNNWWTGAMAVRGAYDAGAQPTAHFSFLAGATDRL